MAIPISRETGRSRERALAKHPAELPRQETDEPVRAARPTDGEAEVIAALVQGWVRL